MNTAPSSYDVERDATGEVSDEFSTGINGVLFYAACFYSVVSLAIVILTAYFRQPFETPSLTVVLAYWLAAVLPMFAYAAPYIIFTDKCRHGILGLGGFLVVSTLVTVAGYWGLAASGTALSLVGWIYRRRFQAFKQPPHMLMLISVCAAIAFGSACFFLVNSMQYATVFAPERALAGMHNRDELFHASLASMFAHYGIAGTGLDGLQVFRYHILSHVWLGMTAEGFGVNAIIGYFLGMQIVAIPAVYFSLTVATLAFFGQTEKPENAASLLAVPIALLFASEQWNLVSYLLSESHILGLTLLLLSLPMLRSIGAYLTSSAYMNIAASIAVGLLCLAAKVSVGAVWFAGLLYLFVRTRHKSAHQLAVLATLTAATLWLTARYFLPIEHSANGGVELLHFFRRYPSIAVSNLVPIIVAILLQLKRYPSSSSLDRAWSEMIVLMLVCSALPAFILRLDGGSAYYFINVGTWIATAAVAGRVLSAATYNNSELIIVAGCTLVIVGSTLTQPERRSSLADFVERRNELLEHVVQGGDRTSLKDTSIFNRSALFQIVDAMKETPGVRLSKAFDAAGLKAGDERLVFVEPSAQEFWSMHPTCGFSSFLVPAYFGVPLLKGLPPVKRDCDLGTYYSLATYGPDAASSALSNIDLCRAAQDKGFSSILVVEAEMKVRDLGCK